jgi:hypothetical protein
MPRLMITPRKRKIIGPSVPRSRIFFCRILDEHVISWIIKCLEFVSAVLPNDGLNLHPAVSDIALALREKGCGCHHRLPFVRYCRMD